MKWFLIVYMYHCTGGGIDPGIIPGNCGGNEARVVMPSLEVCRAVRAINAGSKCISEDIEQ